MIRYPPPRSTGEKERESMRREEKKKKREMRLDRERNILKSLNKEEREKKKF